MSAPLDYQPVEAQEAFASDLDLSIDRLATMAVPDADQDHLVHEATELLRQARDLAGDRQ